MNKDPFEEYIRIAEPDKRYKGYVWNTAIGLQAVDGLEPSDYLLETAKRNIEGDITFADVHDLINAYYEECDDRTSTRTEEADKVSSRIVKLLSDNAFVFSVAQIISIHKTLFDGIYEHAGKLRDYNITKQEWDLDGATVLYGNSSDLMTMLEYDINQEREFSYRGLSSNEVIEHIAKFISNLWQIHGFAEGNTRTVSVFLILYLRTLGYDVTNEAFAENSWYFRNALVRANYSDVKNNVYETKRFLELFLRNLMLGEKNELKNRHLHIYAKEQDIEQAKQDIEQTKQDIEDQRYTDCGHNIGGDFSRRTRQNIEQLHEKFGTEIVFGRSDVVSLLGITASPASELLKKMLAAEIIEKVYGRGKGKYRFTCQGDTSE